MPISDKEMIQVLGYEHQHDCCQTCEHFNQSENGANLFKCFVNKAFPWIPPRKEGICDFHKPRSEKE